MNIIETNLKFTQTLSNRTKTNFIILHHSAASGDVHSIHNHHLNQGYVGIGYHYYVRKDGSIYAGRPVQKTGAHCLNYNSVSVGVCFEGNFEKETMCNSQLAAGIWIVQYIKNMYPSATVIRHKDKNATACPGKNFPFADLLKGKPIKKEITLPKDIIGELINGELKVEINNVDAAIKFLEEAKKDNSSLYWILFKIVNRGK